MATATSGPERLTLMERFIDLFHLPYVLGCLVLGALIGPTGQFLAIYLDTLNPGEAFRRTFIIVYGSNVELSFGVGLFEGTLYFLLIFYILYGIRYMRTKLLAAEPKFSELAPLGEEAFHKAFGGVSRNRGPLIVSLIFAVFFVPYYVGIGLLSSGPYFTVYNSSSALLTAFSIGTFTWVYARSLWGLHKFGKEPLHLKSFYEDRMLGLRPVGSLALSLALVYFTMAGLGILSLFVAPDPLTIVFMSGLTVFGATMFFLPLNGIHRRMLEERREGQLGVRREFVRLVGVSGSAPEADPTAAINRLEKLFSHQLIEQKAASIASWPFDTGILGRFAAIILSVTAILLSSVIRQALHF